MEFVILRLILLCLFIGVVQSRILKLNTDEGNLVSDGIDRNFDNSTLSLGVSMDFPDGCYHQYGFLPCAENAGGFFFLILVYQGLLVYGEKRIGKGSKVLFNIIGVGKIGGIIFRILMSLPQMTFFFVSGVIGTKETAQSLVSVGVGIYSGITVFSLTIQWVVCLIAGRRDLPEAETKNTEESRSGWFWPIREVIRVLKDTGVDFDSNEIQSTAGIMLLSLIPYIIVQLDMFTTTLMGARMVTLLALLVSIGSLISYFGYQIVNPWMQERMLEYAQFEVLRNGFLNHVQLQGKLVDKNGKLNTEFIKKLFDDFDKADDENSVTQSVMEKFVLEIIGTGKLKIDEKYAVKEIMKTFDINCDGRITLDEFEDGCKKLIRGASSKKMETNDSFGYVSHEIFNLYKKRKENDPDEKDRIMSRIMSKLLTHAETQLLQSESLVTPDGKPNIDRIQTLFEQFDTDGDKTISTCELEELLKTVNFGESQIKYEDAVRDLFKDFDKDNNNLIDEPEFIEGMKSWVDKAIEVSKTLDKTKSIEKYHEIVWAEDYHFPELIGSLLQIIFGLGIMTFLGGPLMVSILQLSSMMNMPSFSISFVIVPLALNARTALQAILPASHKSEKTDSLTFIEIYGGVIMNNISGMTALLAIVYAKDLKWDFSSEVLTVLVVCATVGSLAYTRKTYPTWTCILVLFLYPFSLGLVYVAQNFWSWN